MKKQIIAVVIFALLLWGCGLLDDYYGYDITVVNDIDGTDNYSVYLDGQYQFKVTPQHSRTIKDVSEGKHLIECGIKVLGYELIQFCGEIYLHGDAKWLMSEHFSFRWYSLE
jgi:hypothetical protein